MCSELVQYPYLLTRKRVHLIPIQLNDTVPANEFIAHHPMARADPWLHTPQTVFFALQSVPAGRATQLWQQKCTPCDDLSACSLFSLLQVGASRGITKNSVYYTYSQTQLYFTY